jgi:hypothetical protein
VAVMELIDVDAHVKLISGCVAIRMDCVFVCLCVCVCVRARARVFVVKMETDAQRTRWATLCPWV